MMDEAKGKGTRIEFRKTIMFKYESEKELFTQIIENESEAVGKSPSEFLVEHVLKTFLPTNVYARTFAKWMYKGYKNDVETGERIKMNTYDVLSEIYGFIAGKIELDEHFGNNMSLVYITASFPDKELKLKKTGDKYKRFKDEILALNNRVGFHKKEEYQKCLHPLVEALLNNDKSFPVKLFLDLFMENYRGISIYKGYYLSLSYFCDMMSEVVHTNPDNSIAIIRLLRPLSKHWNMASTH